MTPIACLAIMTLGLLADGPIPPASSFDALGEDAVQDLVILGETRPILIRLRVMIGDRAFRSSWLEGTRLLHAQLDRDGDGKLNEAEAETGGLALLAAQASTTPKANAKTNDNPAPKSSVTSVEELAEAIRSTNGPFRLQADGLGSRRTDALFDQFDRDKDGQLTRPELSVVVGTLRKLDRDDNELIGADEVEPIGVAEVAAPTMGRPAARDLGIPPAVALSAGESPLKLLRLVMKKYDTGSPRGPGKTDSKLSPEEFAISPKAFTSADTSGDGLLNSDELRAYLTSAPRDAVLDVALSPEPSGHASVTVRGLDGGKPEGLAVRQLSEGVVEIDAGPLRLDIHVDDGLSTIDAIRKTLRAQFAATDANQDGYLEESELTQDNGLPSPLTNLFKPFDRNADGKVYPVEIELFVTKHATAAQGRLTLTASDQGRALFGLLDLDRDRQIGAREVLETYARLTACDRDRDGRISPEEIPHHIQITLARGDLSALLAVPSNNPNVVLATARMAVVPTTSRALVGPPWFRKMDRNHDGDVSRREFLGTHEQFDRLDRDHDGLLGPDEAALAAGSRSQVAGSR
jgi:Ca2+-binding EF-hand superfamily protein